MPASSTRAGSDWFPYMIATRGAARIEITLLEKEEARLRGLPRYAIDSPAAHFADGACAGAFFT